MSTRPPTLDDLTRVVDPTSPVLFPDAATVVYAGVRHPEAAPGISELRVVDPSGTTRVLTSGRFDTDPAVSPDGSVVAFTSKAEVGKDLCVVSAAGGAPRQLTHGLHIVEGTRFSPCGQWLAFTALIDDVSGDPQPALVVRGEPSHKADGLGWLGTARTQVFIVPVTGGEPIRLTQDGPCSSPAWSPDGTMLAFQHVAYDVGQEPIVQRVGLVNVDFPRTSVRFPFAGTGLSGPLVWTPEGSSVIALGDITPRIGLKRLVRLDVSSGAAEVLTKDLDRNVMGGGAAAYPGGAPAFSDDGRLYFCIRDGGQTVIRSLDLDTGDLDQHSFGEGTVVGAMSIQSRRAAVRIADPVTLGELMLIDLDSGEVRQLTDHGTEQLPEVEFLATRPVRFTISDGTTIHGWLLRAPVTEGPAPTLLDIHGGPHNAWTGVADSAHLYHQILAAQGWNVLTLNPRASDGYGEAFFTATVGRWGEADENDFLEPLDELVQQGVADGNRLSVTGYSYGGFMTCWLTSHTQRFSTAVAGGLVCDHHAMRASSDMGGYLRDREIGGPQNAQRLSPVTYVEQVRTPTLILHGKEDQRCPLFQAELWYSRLRDIGVVTELVVYPGGAHGFVLNGPLVHRRDYNQRLIDWVTHPNT